MADPPTATPPSEIGWLADSTALRTNLCGHRKFLPESSDHTNTMLDSGSAILLVALLTSGICALCLYSVYANVIRHETTLHDLRNRVEHLQNQKILHEAQLTGEITTSVEIVEPIEAVELPAESADIQADQPSAVPESSSTKAA